MTTENYIILALTKHLEDRVNLLNKFLDEIDENDPLKESKKLIAGAGALELKGVFDVIKLSVMEANKNVND